jgi:excisionase family DNA binding protein
MNMVMTVEEQYYTVQEIAKRLRVTRQAIYNWIDEGRLQAVKVGRSLRIPESALRAFIQPAEPGARDEREANPSEDAYRAMKAQSPDLEGTPDD